MNDSEIIEALIAYSKKRNLNAFAKSLGLDRSDRIRHVKIGKNRISEDLADLITTNYPDIRKEWLMSGTGDMTYAKTTLLNAEETNHKLVPYYEKLDPTINVKSLREYTASPTFYIDYQHFSDCEAYIPVMGDAMAPKYNAGELISLKPMENLDALPWGDVFFVMTNENANNLRILRYIFPHIDQSKLILRASNPAYAGDLVINKEDINAIYLIKGGIYRNHL